MASSSPTIRSTLLPSPVYPHRFFLRSNGYVSRDIFFFVNLDILSLVLLLHIFRVSMNRCCLWSVFIILKNLQLKIICK